MALIIAANLTTGCALLPADTRQLVDNLREDHIAACRVLVREHQAALESGAHEALMMLIENEEARTLARIVAAQRFTSCSSRIAEQ